MTEKEFLKLKRNLPKGYRETLAGKFDVTTGYIDQILRGEKQRTDVIDEAIEMATAHKLYLAEQKAKIKKL